MGPPILLYGFHAAEMDFGAHAFFDAVKEGANLGVNGLLIAMIFILGVVVIQLDRRRERERGKEIAVAATERASERKDADAKHAELLSHHNAFVATMVAERASIQTERVQMQLTLIGMVKEQVAQSVKTEEVLRNLSTELHDFRDATNDLTVAIGQLRKP